MVKINSDASLYCNGTVSLGVIHRDEYGHVLVVIVVKGVHGAWESKVAEAFAVVYGLSLTLE